MIQTILMDDDYNSCIAAKVALEAYDGVEIKGMFTDSKAMFDFLEKEHADILFLDIELGEESGFDIATRVKEEYPELGVIFLTGHCSYAVDSFDFEPLYFLTKPIDHAKMDKAMEFVYRHMGRKDKKSHAKISLKGIGRYYIFDINDICYIERRNRKNILVTEKEEIQIAYYTMNELMDILEDYGFYHCYQSFIISVPRIEALWNAGHQSYFARVRGREEAIPVSRRLFEPLLKMTYDGSL